ncbi:ABC transporter ATP-binding protein [Enterovirga sp.]|jgi:NitT/TauT family transport system ATP-binding protein|uniref:ABC transporter ATP-binding protein n=1 Tax=Enterovirga sp. TaxID=2026350 RepID=UPI00261AD261|nr:ABC transporter ATP-binding protein [Enterovirga sp.]MDB5592043.1 transporter ATP-binding protein [Enterovirga sp.]
MTATAGALAQVPVLAAGASAPAPVLIEFDRVAKVYKAADGRPVRAVDSVKGEIRAGEFVSILGPSGCGKSTLMMMLAGLLRPSEGEIRFKGKPVTGPQEGFGIVFQDAVLFPWRTVQDNVRLPGEVRGLPRDEQIERAQAMIRLVGLAGFESKFPHELSGGMQQRVAIARALSLGPSLLVMDEPFGALDAMTREQMNLELQRISLESGATVVFVTHSIAEAAFLSDRVFVMSGRPSTVRDIVTVDLPRPRAIQQMNTDRFGVYVARLRGLLDAEGGHS